VRCVVFDGTGGPEVVRSRELASPGPLAREVLLEVRYAALNHSDSRTRGGRLRQRELGHRLGPLAGLPGIEVAGTVIECGALADRWQVGDQVFGLADGGAMADRVAVPEQQVTAVPARLTAEQAAATPEAFITAHDALVSCANVRPGSRVLVTGASGGVGSAAVQIALAAGADVVGTARSAGGLDLVKSLGATPLDHRTWLASGTGPGRFDVIIELVGGPSVAAGIQRLATRGSLVVVGAPEGREVTLSLRALADSRGSITGTYLRQRTLEEKAAAVGSFGREVVPLLARGALTPQIDSVFSLERAQEAFARLEEPGKLGKVLIEFADP
jgi:NADPH:quinone reductase